MSKKKNLKDFDIDKILENTREPIKYEIVDAMNDWGLEYAYATLLDRALIYNYDFVKPVQLRSIWGMYKQGLRPDKGNVKEGQVQATIMGKYHPHSDCLRGDTKIYLVNGETKTIKEMYEETLKNPNKTYNVYSIDKDGCLVRSVLSHARIGQFTNNIYKITLSNDMIIECTDNHPFMMFDKQYKQAKNLNIGDVVASGELIGDKEDYPIINIRLDSKNKRTAHNLFSMAKELLPNVDEGYVYHHEDENKHNQELKNFKQITRAEHALHHKDYLIGYECGRHELFEGKYKECTRKKNSELAKELNKHYLYYRAMKLINYLQENNIEVSNDNYNKYFGVFYNRPKISTLIKKGYIKNDVIELLDNKPVFDSSKSIGFIQKEEKDKVNKNEYHKNSEYSEKFNCAVRAVGLCMLNNLEVSHESIKKVNRKYHYQLNIKDDSVLEDVLNSNVIISIKNIEIIEADNEPMYDFTVENYENALFVDNNNFVILHNSSIKGVLDGWAQAFNSRVPLVKTTGQPGRFTGDSAPAARYLEVGMNKACYELVRDTQNHGCLWTFNEQGDEIMPLTLPTRWPLGIINGTQGIATGFACNIPPHNPDEVMKACIAYLQGKIDNPNKLYKYIKGPDFPTGATIIGIDGIKQYLETGEGKFIVRGKYSVKELGKGRVEIDFTELPYNVSVEQVITDINNKKKKNGKFFEISEIKDLSDRRFQTDKCEVKLAIYVKAGANINKLIDELYQYTRCQVSYSVNATTIIDNKPHMNTSMYEMIEGFCRMRKDVYKLRSDYRLKVIEKDLHILDGLLKVLVDIDEAIKIIRNSDNSDIASEKLQKKFKVDSVQANQILLMTLKQLTKADSIEIKQKQKSLVEENKTIHDILNNETLLNNEIVKEIQDTLKIISSPRRTEIVGVSMEEMKQQQKEIEKQHKLLAKGVECFVNINKDKIGKSIESNDNSKFKVMSDSNIFIIGKDGNCKELEVEKLPLDDEQSISIFANGNDNIAGITSDSGYETLVVSNLGNINVFKNKFKSGLLCKLKDEELMFASPISEEDRKNNSLVMINKQGELFKMDIEKLKSVNAGSGLIVGTKMKDIVFVGMVHHNSVIKTVSNNEIKYTSVEECPSKGRGSSGYLLHKLKKDDEIISCEIIEMSDEVILTNRGKSGIKRK